MRLKGPRSAKIARLRHKTLKKVVCLKCFVAIAVLFRTALLLLWQEQSSPQEVTVSRFVIVLLFLMITSLPAPGQSVPEIPYESVPNLLKLPPHLYLGEACGVAVNSKGHIFVFSGPGTRRRASNWADSAWRLRMRSFCSSASCAVSLIKFY